MEYFNKRMETDFEISVFTHKESLEEFLKIHNIEILLSEEKLDLEEQISQNIRYIYQLSDGSSVKNHNEGFWINKYQSVRTIVDRIMDDYLEKEQITKIKNTLGKTNIISVFSPVQGQEKLLFSWALSLQMANEAKVLFVLLDPLAIPLLSTNDNKKQSLSEYIYFLKENLNLSKMKSLFEQCDNLTYLSGISHGADILSLSRDDVQKWVEDYRENSEYDSVVFYLGCYTEAIIELINLSDTVLVTSINNTYEEAVLREWERQMDHVDISLRNEKFQFIELHVQEELRHVPLTIQQLMETISWREAETYFNS
jgi:hypothetical protein